MASISKEPGGRKTIQFVAADGKRRSIRLGKVSQRQADAVKVRVEQLAAAAITGHTIDSETAAWIANLEPMMADRLAAVGLIPDHEKRGAATIGAFLSDYIEGRTDVKPASKLVWGHVKRNLVEYYGESRDVRKITPGDADDFKQYLLRQELAATTVHKRLQFARTFFRAMVRRKILAENPFADVKSPAAGIADRQRFVTREEIDRVLEACPDHHWRTIVALSRFGGLRCPSEVLSLKLDDIRWDEKRIVVTSPKTEHHPGKETRVIPLFPELEEHLRTSDERAKTGEVYVVDERFRKAAMGVGGWANANLRTTFEKIIKRAGLAPWPRLFHNLRASRETELVENFPVHVVATWLGNTPAIAMRHYLMTTDEHFAQAVEDAPTEEAVQNPVQQPSEMACLASNDALTINEESPEFPGFSSKCDSLQIAGMEDRGLEPLTSCMPCKIAVD